MLPYHRVQRSDRPLRVNGSYQRLKAWLVHGVDIQTPPGRIGQLERYDREVLEHVTYRERQFSVEIVVAPPVEPSFPLPLTTVDFSDQLRLTESK